MATQVAKKRFMPNTPVKAGVLYKAVVNGKDYIVKAKYNKTLSAFNAMWFENLSPKQYFFNPAEFNDFTGVILPSDEIIMNDIVYTNEQTGALTKDELEVLFSTYKESRLVSGLLLTGSEDHRIHKINIRPYRNANCEELKYFSMNNWGRNVTVRTLRVNTVQEVVFEVTETYTIAQAGAANNHNCIVDFTGYSVTYEGISPSSTTSTTAAFAIPNALTSRKLTITPNGVDLILKFELWP